MDVIYAQLIIKGLKKIIDVPEVVKADTKKELERLGYSEISED